MKRETSVMHIPLGYGEGRVNALRHQMNEDAPRMVTGGRRQSRCSQECSDAHCTGCD